MSENAAGGPAFKPDPPKKATAIQTLLLFTYHVVLAILLGYAIYNVWPPQPWPGDNDNRAATNSNQRNANTTRADNSNTAGNVNNANSANNANNATNANNANNTNTANNTNRGNNAGNNNAGNSNAGGDCAGGDCAGNNNAGGGNTNNSAADQSTDTVEERVGAYGRDKPPCFRLFGMNFRPPLETRLILIVLLVGALGGYIHAASSLVDYLGNRTFVSSWIWWYLLRPFIGMTLALVFYFVFRGGFITAGANAGGEGAAIFINPFGVAALAGLVGMFSKVAADKLNEVFTTLFRPKEGDERRRDKLQAKPTPAVSGIDPKVGAAAGGTAVTITGTDFVNGAKVTFGGVSATNVEVKSATSITAVTPAHAAGAVDVEVVNPNEQKGVLKGGFTYQ